MKGANELILNSATVLEAMQLWLDANFKEPLKADYFTEDSKSASVISFRLRVVTPPKLEEKADG